MFLLQTTFHKMPEKKEIAQDGLDRLGKAQKYLEGQQHLDKAWRSIANAPEGSLLIVKIAYPKLSKSAVVSYPLCRGANIEKGVKAPPVVQLKGYSDPNNALNVGKLTGELLCQKHNLVPAAGSIASEFVTIIDSKPSNYLFGGIRHSRKISNREEIISYPVEIRDADAVQKNARIFIQKHDGAKVEGQFLSIKQNGPKEFEITILTQNPKTSKFENVVVKNTDIAAIALVEQGKK